MLINSANTAQAGTPNQLPDMGQIGIMATSRMKSPTPTQGIRMGSTKLFLFFIRVLVSQPGGNSALSFCAIEAH